MGHDESKHPRSAGGQWTEKAFAEPSGVTLAERPARAQLGGYEVDAEVLEAARELNGLVQGMYSAEDWQVSEAARQWAEERGHTTETHYDWSSADNAHGHQSILVTSYGVSIALSGQGRGRNFSVDVEDGRGDNLDYGDEDGEISPVTFIYLKNDPEGTDR